MNRLFRILTWLMWVTLPLTAARFWLAWDQLPLRMATHFDASWHPNGWMPKEVAFGFALAITALMLLVFTVILIVMQREKTAAGFSWVFLAFSYLVIGFVFYANDKVVSYNLAGEALGMNFWAFLVSTAVIALTAIYLQTKRSPRLPASPPLAEEVHNSALWGAVMFVSAAGMVMSILRAPVLGFRIGVGLLAAFLLICGLAAWSGFNYSFTPSGLEVSTLGYRLRSIPKEQIKNYAIAPWSIARGYGIRGIGDFRAYVWGNSGVQLSTAQGQIFLGHSDPARIVRDLDMITRQHARQD